MSETVFTESVLTYPEAFDIFEKPVQSYGIKRSSKLTLYPTNDYGSNNILQFNLENSGPSYIDLKQTTLNITCKILNKDGTPIISAQRPDQVFGTDEEDGTTEKKETGDDEPFKIMVSVANNFLHSMFSRCDITLQRSVTSSNDCYPYSSYIKSLLYNTKETQESGLTMQMFYKDTPFGIADSNPLFGYNEGLKTRSKFFQNSHQVEMSGVLKSDIMETNRFLPNGVSLSVTLYPSSPEFCLISPDIKPVPDFKIKILHASLDVTMVEPSPEILISHADVLKTKPAIFPYMKSEIKKFSIAKGLHSTEISNPFSNQIPSELIIGFVSNRSAYGDIGENPFNFKNCLLTSVRASVDGQDMGRGTLELNFQKDPEKGSYLQGYETLLGMGDNPPNTSSISRLEYPQGYTFYRYTWQGGDRVEDDILPTKRFGSLRLSFKFAEELKEPMTAVLFARFPAALKIDQNRAVFEI